MSGLSRRELLFGRLFGRGPEQGPRHGPQHGSDEATEAASDAVTGAACDTSPASSEEAAREGDATPAAANEPAAATPNEEGDGAPAWTRPERVPPPPWERAEPAAPSPVAQVAPWELATVQPGASPPPSPRAAHLGGPRMAPGGRRMLFSIQENLCLAYRSVPCSVCRERCPEPGAVVVQEGRPTIDPALCTACGDCIAVCPAPIMAIRMTPAPRPPAEGAPR